MALKKVKKKNFSDKKEVMSVILGKKKSLADAVALWPTKRWHMEGNHTAGECGYILAENSART